MKTVFGSVVVVMLLAAPLHLSAANAAVSSEISEIVKLHDAGVSEEVMLAHVQNSSIPQPTAQDIIYLHEAGISKSVITALIQKQRSQPQVAAQPAPENGSRGSGRALAKPQWEQPSYSVPASSASPAPATVVVQSPMYVQPSPVYVEPPVRTYYSYPYYYDYGYPYYGYRYPYYYDSWYGPTFSIGFGFGNYWGWGHHRHHWGGHHWGHHGGHHHGGLHWTGNRGGHRGGGGLHFTGGRGGGGRGGRR